MYEWVEVIGLLVIILVRFYLVLVEYGWFYLGYGFLNKVKRFVSIVFLKYIKIIRILRENILIYFFLILVLIF